MGQGNRYSIFQPPLPLFFLTFLTILIASAAIQFSSSLSCLCHPHTCASHTCKRYKNLPKFIASLAISICNGLIKTEILHLCSLLASMPNNPAPTVLLNFSLSEIKIAGLSKLRDERAKLSSILNRGFNCHTHSSSKYSSNFVQTRQNNSKSRQPLNCEEAPMFS